MYRHYKCCDVVRFARISSLYNLFTVLASTAKFVPPPQSTSDWRPWVHLRTIMPKAKVEISRVVTEHQVKRQHEETKKDDSGNINIAQEKDP